MRRHITRQVTAPFSSSYLIERLLASVSACLSLCVCLSCESFPRATEKHLNVSPIRVNKQEFKEGVCAINQLQVKNLFYLWPWYLRRGCVWVIVLIFTTQTSLYSSASHSSRLSAVMIYEKWLCPSDCFNIYHTDISLLFCFLQFFYTGPLQR